MKYDNERDRNRYGYDAGHIIDGIITPDPNTGELVLVDEDGVAFSSQEAFKSLLGKKVRLTMISIDSIELLQNLVEESERRNSLCLLSPFI